MIYSFIASFKISNEKTHAKISLSKRKYLLLQLRSKNELTKEINNIILCRKKRKKNMTN